MLQEASATSATRTFDTIGKTAVPADVTGLLLNKYTETVDQ